MGMPEAPIFNQSDYRARDNVPDPSGVDAAFDAGDTAANTGWTQTVDEQFRARLVIKQTHSIADVTQNLTQEFLWQYQNVTAVSGWLDVGAVGADVEDVQFRASTGFADHDNTGQLLGAGSNVAGDGLETNVATDTITFTTTALSETELEASLEIVGANVTDADVIELRVLMSNNDEAPPATVLDAYDNTPSITVDKPAGAGNPWNHYHQEMN